MEWTDKTKATTVWTEKTKSGTQENLRKEDSYNLLLENGFKIVLTY